MVPGYDEWKTTPPEEQDRVEEKLNGPGYTEIVTLNFVPEEDAFDYALEQCVESAPQGFRDIEWTQKFREMLVEWFYSGNWIKED